MGKEDGKNKLTIRWEVQVIQVAKLHGDHENTEVYMLYSLPPPGVLEKKHVPKSMESRRGKVDGGAMIWGKASDSFVFETDVDHTPPGIGEQEKISSPMVHLSLEKNTKDPVLEQEYEPGTKKEEIKKQFKLWLAKKEAYEKYRIGESVKLNLGKYIDHGSNMKDQFGIPKQRNEVANGDCAYVMTVNVKAQWIKYNGRALLPVGPKGPGRQDSITIKKNTFVFEEEEVKDEDEDEERKAAERYQKEMERLKKMKEKEERKKQRAEAKKAQKEKKNEDPEVLAAMNEAEKEKHRKEKEEEHQRKQELKRKQKEEEAEEKRRQEEEKLKAREEKRREQEKKEKTLERKEQELAELKRLEKMRHEKDKREEKYNKILARSSTKISKKEVVAAAGPVGFVACEKRKQMEKIRVQISIQVQAAVNVPNDKTIQIAWRRGTKAEWNYTDETLSGSTEQDTARWEPPARIVVECSLRRNKDTKVFDSKNLALAIVEADTNTHLAKAVVDLSAYANDGTDCPLVLALDAGGTTLEGYVECKWIPHSGDGLVAVAEKSKSNKKDPKRNEIVPAKLADSTNNRTESLKIVSTYKGSKTRVRVKVQFTIVNLAVEHLSQADGETVFLAYEGGSRKLKAETPREMCESGSAYWSSTSISFSCNMEYHIKSNSFNSKKSVSFTLKAGGKKITLGKSSLPLAPNGEHDVAQRLSIPLVLSKKQTGATLNFDLHSEWVKFDGKHVVSSKQKQGSKHADDQEYGLETASEQSEISEVTDVGGNGSDDELDENGLDEGEMEMRGIISPKDSASQPKQLEAPESAPKKSKPLHKMHSFGGMVNSKSMEKLSTIASGKSADTEQAEEPKKLSRKRRPQSMVLSPEEAAKVREEAEKARNDSQVMESATPGLFGKQPRAAPAVVKSDVKVEFVIEAMSVAGVPKKSAKKQLFVAWMAGEKEGGESARVGVVDRTANWAPPVGKLEISLKRNPMTRKFDDEFLLLQLKEFVFGKKATVLAKASTNLAEIAEVRKPQNISLPLGKKFVLNMVISANIADEDDLGAKSLSAKPSGSISSAIPHESDKPAKPLPDHAEQVSHDIKDNEVVAASKAEDKVQAEKEKERNKQIEKESAEKAKKEKAEMEHIMNLERESREQKELAAKKAKQEQEELEKREAVLKEEKRKAEVKAEKESSEKKKKKKEEEESKARKGKGKTDREKSSSSEIPVPFAVIAEKEGSASRKENETTPVRKESSKADLQTTKKSKKTESGSTGSLDSPKKSDVSRDGRLDLDSALEKIEQLQQLLYQNQQQAEANRKLYRDAKKSQRDVELEVEKLNKMLLEEESEKQSIVAQFENRMQSLLSEKAGAQAELAIMKSKAGTKSQTQVIEQQAHNLRKESDEQKAMIEEQRIQLVSMRKEKEMAIQKAAALSQQLKTAEENFIEADKRAIAAEADRRAYGQQIKSLEEKVEQALKSEQKAKLEAEALKKQLEASILSDVAVANAVDKSKTKKPSLQSSELEKENLRLQARLKTMEADLAQCRNTLVEYQAKEKKLRTKLATLSTPVLPITGNEREDVSMLRRELEDIAAVESAVYHSEVQWDTQCVAMAATKVSLLLQSRDVFEQGNRRLLDRVYVAVESSYRKCGRDNKQVAYWLSVVTSLLHIFQSDNKLLLSGDIIRSGILSPEAIRDDSSSSGDTSDSDNSSSDEEGKDLSLAEEFEKRLNVLAFDIFSQYMRNVYEELDKYIIPAMLEQDLSVLHDNKPLPFKHGISPENITSLLSEMMYCLQDSYIYDSIIIQIFRSTLHYISATVFNQLLTKTIYCNPRTGFQIKMGISVLMAWITEMDSQYDEILRGTGRFLDPLVEAANVLTLATNPEVFDSEESLRSTFPSLNIVQIKRLLEDYRPDQFAPEEIPSEVMRNIKKLYNDTENVEELNEFITPTLSIEKDD